MQVNGAFHSVEESRGIMSDMIFPPTSNQTKHVSLSSSEWKTCTEVHRSPRGLAAALVSDLTEHSVAADVVGLQDTSDMKQNEAL